MPSAPFLTTRAPRWTMLGLMFLLALLLLSAQLHPSPQPPPPSGYTLAFQLLGEARGRILGVVPYRFHFQAGNTLHFTTGQPSSLPQTFTLADWPEQPAFILRTLGFSGRHMLLMAVSPDEETLRHWGHDTLNSWPGTAMIRPETLKRRVWLPYRPRPTPPETFSFERLPNGRIRNVHCTLNPIYRHHPQKTGVTFQIHRLMAAALLLMSPPVLPGNGSFAKCEDLPEAWTPPPILLAPILNRMLPFTEQFVPSVLHFHQSDPLCLQARLAPGHLRGQDVLRVEVHSTNQPHVWQSCRILKLERHSTLRRLDGALLEDRLEVMLGPRKSPWGQMKLCLTAREAQAEPQS